MFVLGNFCAVLPRAPKKCVVSGEHKSKGEEWKTAAAIVQGANAFRKHIALSGSDFFCLEVNYLKTNCLTTDLNEPGNFPALDQNCKPLL